MERLPLHAQLCCFNASTTSVVEVSFHDASTPGPMPPSILHGLLPQQRGGALALSKVGPTSQDILKEWRVGLETIAAHSEFPSEVVCQGRRGEFCAATTDSRLLQLQAKILHGASSLRQDLQRE